MILRIPLFFYLPWLVAFSDRLPLYGDKEGNQQFQDFITLGNRNFRKTVSFMVASVESQTGALCSPLELPFPPQKSLSKDHQPDGCLQYIMTVFQK